MVKARGMTNKIISQHIPPIFDVISRWIVSRVESREEADLNFFSMWLQR